MIRRRSRSPSPLPLRPGIKPMATRCIAPLLRHCCQTGSLRLSVAERIEELSFSVLRSEGTLFMLASRQYSSTPACCYTLARWPASPASIPGLQLDFEKPCEFLLHLTCCSPPGDGTSRSLRQAGEIVSYNRMDLAIGTPVDDDQAAGSQ